MSQFVKRSAIQSDRRKLECWHTDMFMRYFADPALKIAREAIGVLAIKVYSKAPRHELVRGYHTTNDEIFHDVVLCHHL